MTTSHIVSLIVFFYGLFHEIKDRSLFVDMRSIYLGIFNIIFVLLTLQFLCGASDGKGPRARRGRRPCQVVVWEEDGSALVASRGRDSLGPQQSKEGLPDPGNACQNLPRPPAVTWIVLICVYDCICWMLCSGGSSDKILAFAFFGGKFGFFYYFSRSGQIKESSIAAYELF